MSIEVLGEQYAVTPDEELLRLARGSNFRLPAYADPAMLSGNAVDYVRYFAQLHVTAPFYAGIGYALGAWLSIRSAFGDALERRLYGYTRAV